MSADDGAPPPGLIPVASPPAAPVPAAPGPRVGRHAYLFVYVTVTLDMIALGIVIPVLPRLVLEFTGGDAGSAARTLGVFGTAWASMQFVFSPLLGSLSDRYGRRPIILLSNFGLGLDYILMALAPGIGLLFVGRIISGISAASFSTSAAYVADVAPVAERARAYGWMSVCFGVGFVLGPALGGVLGSVDPRLPFWVAAALSLLNGCYGIFVLPESLVTANRSPFRWQDANPVGALGLLRRYPGLLLLSAINFLGQVAQQSLPSVFVLYAGYRYGWDARTVGLALALSGACSALVGAVLVNPTVKHFGERAALVGGLLFGFAAFACFGLAPTGSWFLIGIPLLSLWGLATPAAQAMMTDQVSVREQGQLQGAGGSLFGISGLIGPILYSSIFAAAIAPGATLHLPGAPYLLSAALMLASAVMVFGLPLRAVTPETARSD